MQRFGKILRVKEGKFEEYKRQHQAVWPEVLEVLRIYHLSNYSIYHKDGLLFTYYEYTGEDYQADMNKMAQEPANKKWSEFMRTLQEPLPTRKAGEWWANMEEIFHLDREQP
ncbi:MAG: L-rhamnose mutarotase [Chitinivibrionales bacterium]|nr:L-rhamnose mutarotase [Chitinivibrionales bacterium]